MLFRCSPAHFKGWGLTPDEQPAQAGRLTSTAVAASWRAGQIPGETRLSDQVHLAPAGTFSPTVRPAKPAASK